MSIHIDSCAARETIVVNTRSSVYELIVHGASDGELLVRGGGHFPSSALSCSSVQPLSAGRSSHAPLRPATACSACAVIG